MDPHRKSIIHGSGQSCYRTPSAMAGRLVEYFSLAWDLAATSETKVTPERHLGPGSAWSEDALAVAWSQLQQPRGFLNPPFSLSEIKTLREAGVPTDDPRIRALRIEEWARKAFNESEAGFTTIGVFPYAPQTEWFRCYVMGHNGRGSPNGWSGHAALDYWRLPHRVSFLTPDGQATNNAGVNSCIIHWGPNPGFIGPWVPSGRYWSYR